MLNFRPDHPVTHPIPQLSLSTTHAFKSSPPFSNFTPFPTISFHLKRGFSSITMSKRGFWLRQAYPAYCNVRLLIVFIMFCLWKSFSNSLFFLTLHSPVPSFFTDLKIFLMVFLSKIIVYKKASFFSVLKKFNLAQCFSVLRYENIIKLTLL